MKILWPLKAPTAGWSGVWQMAYRGDYPGKTSVIFLPMIDLSPSDLSCIYSTMQFVCDQASRYESIPILTFDQPLNWKSFQIRANENENCLIKKMVLQLRGFHMCMSYLGAVGQIMLESGLQEMSELVSKPPNSVPYIPCGKSYSRAVRAHMLLDTALYTSKLKLFAVNLQNM